MIAPAALLIYAATVATVGAQLLRRSAWPTRAPMWGVMAWQALTASVISATVLAGAALALPAMPFTADVAALLRACAMALQAEYATPAGAALSATGAVLVLTVLGRVGYYVAVAIVGAAIGRRKQLRALMLVARRHERCGALVIDHPTALAYCLPGRRREIVLTTAALAALDESEISAVLAHEHAHLRGRHDLVVAAASALEHAFPRLPVFRHARVEITRLVEMLADDVATRRGDRFALATALVGLAGGHTPAATLGAGGDTALVRVQRLLAPVHPVGRLHALLISGLVAAMLAVPLLIVSAPAVVAAARNYCPVII